MLLRVRTRSICNRLIKRISPIAIIVFTAANFVRNSHVVFPYVESQLSWHDLNGSNNNSISNNTSSNYGISFANHPMNAENHKIREADLFKSVCLSSDSRNHHSMLYKDVFGSWDHKTSNRSDADSINIASKVWVSFNRAIDDEFYETMTSHANVDWGLPRVPPLMLVIGLPNPSHCVQDMLFSLLPLVYRGDLKGTRAVAVNLPYKDYCISTLTALGWFEQIHIVHDQTCFDKLWVPAFMHNRFPRGRSRGIEFGNGNGYLHKEDLPIEMIQFFQREMWRSVLANNNPFLSEYNSHRTILFVSRRGEHRRIWQNVDDIAVIVREKLSSGATVRIIDNVGDFSLKEQAAIYHSADVLVTPHSGSNANIVYMRPKTTVFEIHCTGDSWVREWVIDLGIHHRNIIADAPRCDNHDEKFVAVQPSTLVEPILHAYAKVTGIKIESEGVSGGGKITS